MREDLLCPCGCGFPRDRAWDPEADGWIEARERVCYARAARERWQEDHSGDDRAEPGTLTYLVDLDVDSPQD